MTSPAPARRRAFRIAAAACAALVALIAVETAFRLVLGERFAAAPAPRRVEQVLGRFDPDVGWRLAPDGRERVRGDGFVYDVALDAHGFRNAALGDRPPAGVPRIALVGDSIGFGWAVEADATFAALLGRDPRVGAEIVNLCVPGYSTDQELWTLEREGARVAPDVVLLQFHVNDLDGNETMNSHRLLKPRFSRDVRGAWRVENRPVAEFLRDELDPPRPGGALLSRFALWQVVTGQTPLVAPAAPPAAPAVANARRSGDGRPLIGPDSATRHALELLVAECRTLNARLVAFAVPPLGPPDPVPFADKRPDLLYATSRALAAAGDDLGFATLAIDRPLHDAWAAGTAITVPDGHWNAEGHRLAAEALAPQLASFLASGASK